MLVAQLSVRGLALLRILAREQTPMSTTALRQLFSDHGVCLDSHELSSALRRLERRGYVTSVIGPAPNRAGIATTARIWTATQLGEKQAESAMAALRLLG